LLYSGKRS